VSLLFWILVSWGVIPRRYFGGGSTLATILHSGGCLPTISWGVYDSLSVMGGLYNLLLGLYFMGGDYRFLVQGMGGDSIRFLIAFPPGVSARGPGRIQRYTVYRPTGVGRIQRYTFWGWDSLPRLLSFQTWGTLYPRHFPGGKVLAWCTRL
jgi:hypothetical protein